MLTQYSVQCWDKISPVVLVGAEGEGEASREEEEAMRCPALQTSLLLTGHSLATRSALNSPDTAQNTTAQSNKAAENTAGTQVK